MDYPGRLFVVFVAIRTSPFGADVNDCQGDGGIFCRRAGIRTL